MMIRGYYDDGLSGASSEAPQSAANPDAMDDQNFKMNALEHSKISRGHHHIVIISHAEKNTKTH